MKTFLGVILTCIILPAYATAQNKALKNLESLGVFVTEFTPALRKTSLSRDKLSHNIEFRLRRNGIIVSDTSTADLYLNINCIALNNKDGTVLRYVYNISLSLHQPLSLSKGYTVWATTWDISNLGFTTPSLVEDAIEKGVHSLMTIFLNDYLKVNPG